MNVAEILRRSNQASLDSLVPLTKIQTRTDMKRYAQNGYSVGITAKEFSERYPHYYRQEHKKDRYGGD